MTYVPLRRLTETACKFQDHHSLELSCLPLRLAVLTERGTIDMYGVLNRGPFLMLYITRDWMAQQDTN